MSTQLVDEILSAANSGELRLNWDQNRSLSNMQTCRTVDRGGRLLVCENCGTIIAFYNPCNQRGCPICYEKRQIQWKVRLQNRLVPVSHYHLIFSIPQFYTDIWLRDKKAVMDGLFTCVSNAIKELGKSYGLMLGYVLVFQSQGRGMTYKPHIHCILTAGGLDENKKWIDIGSLKYTKLEESLKENLHEEIAKNLERDNLLLGGKAINEKEYKVYSTYHPKTGKWIAEYLSHSIAGVVIDMDEEYIEHKENGTVEIIERHNGKQITTVLKKIIFFERYMNHIPPGSAVTARSYGLYSNRNTEDLEIVNKQFQNQKEEIVKSEKIIERCPVCNTPMVVVFEIDPKKMTYLMRKRIFGNGPPKHKQILITA